MVYVSNKTMPSQVARPTSGTACAFLGLQQPRKTHKCGQPPADRASARVREYKFLQRVGLRCRKGSRLRPGVQARKKVQ